MIESLWLAAPLIMLLTAALVVMVADLLLPRDVRGWLGFITIAGLTLAFVLLHVVGLPAGADRPLFMGAMKLGYVPFLAQNVIIGGAIFIALISPGYLVRREIPLGEYYTLLLVATLGMVALAATTELLTLFLNIELL